MTTQSSTTGLTETREKLKSHMAQYAGSDYVQGWDELWKKGDFLPWDRGSPSPALADTLVNHSSLIGNAMVDGRRKRALVPGCGRGVDVLLLASFGYDVVGLEYAEGALRACLDYVTKHEDEYTARDEKVGEGERKFIRGDFYSDDWLKMTRWPDFDGKFDLIYDYTFFCAMQPSMRKDWAKRMTELLRPSPQANLICLEFPVNKPAKSGGPPFASPSKAYVEHLSHPGEDIGYGDDGNVKMNPLVESSPTALERVGHWHPANTHQVGKDKDGNVEDSISVWRHR